MSHNCLGLTTSAPAEAEKRARARPLTLLGAVDEAVCLKWDRSFSGPGRTKWFCLHCRNEAWWKHCKTGVREDANSGAFCWLQQVIFNGLFFCLVGFLLVFFLAVLVFVKNCTLSGIFFSPSAPAILVFVKNCKLHFLRPLARPHWHKETQYCFKLCLQRMHFQSPFRKSRSPTWWRAH